MSAAAPSRRLLAALLALAALAVVLAAGTGKARAEAPILYYNAGPSTSQAGAHPDAVFNFGLGNRFTQGSPSECFCENPKDLQIGLPTGLIGDPHAAPTCTAAEFATLQCPPESQVGLQALLLATTLQNGGQWALTPVFNLVPAPNQAGLLGFNQPIIPAPIFTVLNSRTRSDYGLDATVSGVTQFVPVFGVLQVLWGVPADPKHDGVRFPRGQVGFLCGIFQDPTPYVFGEPETVPDFCGSIVPTPSNAARKALLSNPTTCGAPLQASLDVLSYDTTISHADAYWPPTVGCDQLGFSPSLSALPTTTQTDAASGLDVNLKVPQSTAPSSPATSEIRAVHVTLPDGFSINPNAADGKESCSDAQANFGTDLPAECPETSKVGTLSIDSPALPGPLPGYIYLGDPKPGDRYRLVIKADGFAVHVKLPGSVHADPGSGRVAVSFDDLPQTTFSEFDMHFFGSERGLLATPTRCGTYQVDSEFVPWANELPNQTSTQFFSLGSGPAGKPCPGQRQPFDPTLSAGVTDNTAGAHSTFTATFSRGDGDQILDRLDLGLPPGFAATLKGVPDCPPAAIAAARSQSGRGEASAPSCPAASQIGTVVAGVGAGSHPLYVNGKAYLAGPYQGAPLSLVAVVPAVSGPYDLGDVVVQTALRVDPVTAQVTALTDPLPRILEGIPLRLRSLLVTLDRPGFALNPTNCDPLSVGATMFGDEGALASPSVHFQVANCALLPFSPKLSLVFRGGSKRRGHPALRAVVRAAPGEANIARAVVTMPKNEQLDNAHIGDVCTRPEFARDACPARSLLGTAEATTPLLDQPLKGRVYLRSNPAHELPDVVADLRGQIDFELSGVIDTAKGGGLRTSFESVPDAPVTRFVLDLKGGEKGLLINSHGLCGQRLRAGVKLVGQNGVRVSRRTPLQTGCGKSSRHKRHVKGKRDGRRGA